MTTEPPGGGGWQPPASYPAPMPGMPPARPTPPPAGPAQDPDRLPDPPGRPGESRFDGPLPEPPAGLAPALQWGDPTPAPAPPPRLAPKPYSRLAVAALVVGALAGGAGLALIIGAVALLRIRRTKRRGTGLAVAGMVLTVLWAGAAWATYTAVLSKPSVRDANGVVVRKGDVPVNQLQVGDCIEKWATSTKVGEVTVIPCTSAHDAEVFHTFDLEGKAFPGDQFVTKQATTGCLDKSKTAVKEADLKNAKVALLKPLQASWGRGDHRVTCVAVQNSGTITRSIRT